jgi:photosystem II stability/assembly factor-like uncharacterized protein
MVAIFGKPFRGCALASAILALSWTGSSATAQDIPAAAGVQSLQQVWTIGASTAWAWTHGSATGSPQALELTVNGGASWTKVTPPGLGVQKGDRFITGFYALNAKHAWVTYGGAANGAAQVIDSTSDGGRHWMAVGHEPLTSIPQSIFVYDCGLDFVTPSDGWCQAEPAFAGSEAVYLYHTTDGGKRWKRIYVTAVDTNPRRGLPFGCDKEIQFTSPSRGWAIFACAGSGTAPMYETADGGKTWSRRDVAKAPGTFDSGSGFAGAPVVAGSTGAVGYTISGRPLKTVVYRSENGGAVWHPVTPPGPARGWVVDAITPVSWRLVQGDHILATGNAGRSWHTVTSNVTFDIYYAYLYPTPPVVNFANAKVGWIVSTSLWRTTNGGSRWRRVSVPGT